MIFSKQPLSSKLPKSLEAEINKLKKIKSKYAALKKAYNIITKKYKGYKLKTYLNLSDIFKNIDEIWSSKGFLHCKNTNYLLRIILIKSRKCTENDIKFKSTLLYYISPHQYLQIKTEKGWIDVDCWAKAYGINLGQHASGFNC